MKFKLWKHIFSLTTCFLMLLAVAVNRDQQLFGKKLNPAALDGQKDTVSFVKKDGTQVINTMRLTKDVSGYGGNTPVEISIKDGRIVDIVALKNSETPDFFRRVERRILSQWNGLTVEEALNTQVDAVSGATLSSNAVLENVTRGLEYAKSRNWQASESVWKYVDAKFMVTLLVILAAVILPSFLHTTRYRWLQLLLNVVVLGFWSGTFISYSLLINFLSNGVNLAATIIPLVLLVIAFIFPLFGKKGYYCAWVCPLGSLQELAFKSVKYRMPLNVKIVRWLNRFRQLLWIVLMLIMWCGLGFVWMDYELFSAFLIQDLSWPIAIAAVLFLLLSFVVNRPYCRFVCPTGTLMKIAQNTK